MGVEFKKNDQLEMNKWIGGNKKYTLLYKATTDSCSATAFHNKCDNKGPTVTILYNVHNSVFGGYTSVSWRSAAAYHNDAYAFLFRLYQNGNRIPIKMPFRGNNTYSIYDEASYGPTFGGHDLKTFTGSVKLTVGGTYYELNGATNFGHSYTVNAETYNTIANGHLRIKDMEVYLVEDLPILEEPWRKTPKWDVKYRMYPIRDWTSGKPLNFTVHDTRGIEADQGIDAHEICFLLDGHIPDRHQFNPSVPLSTDIPGFLTSPHLSEKIHCVVFVIDGSTVDVMPEKVIERIKTLQSRMNQKGVPQVVLLTKIDKICETTGKDLSNVFYSSVIEEMIDRVSQIMGLPRSHILPVKNYEAEMEPNDNVNILTLITLQHMLRFCDDYMDNYLGQNEEVKMEKISIRE